MAKRTYYHILGISRDASLEEITAAKNALAKVYHPDANMHTDIDTTAQMQEILEAYRILSNPEKRKAYDLELGGGKKRVFRTFNMEEEAKQAKVGDKVKVRLSNNTQVGAEITNIINEEDEDIIIILKLKNQIEELINYRKITFDLIWWDASGLKVPNQAIVKINDLDYVVRNRARIFKQNIS